MYLYMQLNVVRIIMHIVRPVDAYMHRQRRARQRKSSRLNLLASRSFHSPHIHKIYYTVYSERESKTVIKELEK